MWPCSLFCASPWWLYVSGTGGTIYSFVSLEVAVSADFFILERSAKLLGKNSYNSKYDSLGWFFDQPRQTIDSSLMWCIQIRLQKKKKLCLYPFKANSLGGKVEQYCTFVSEIKIELDFIAVICLCCGTIVFPMIERSRNLSAFSREIRKREKPRTYFSSNSSQLSSEFLFFHLTFWKYQITPSPLLNKRQLCTDVYWFGCNFHPD